LLVQVATQVFPFLEIPNWVVRLVIAAWADEKDLALQQLEIGVRASVPSQALTYGGLKLLPFWDPLRGDPRFEKIVQSLAPK
jgi:hypothetical protein